MAMSAKFIRSQLHFLKPLMSKLDLESSRKWQTRIGELMQFLRRRNVVEKRHDFEQFDASWILPRDKR